MNAPKLEDIIRQYVRLSNRPNSNGFYSTLCKVCGDHGRKGLRAGFKFHSNGSVGFHCFNCGHSALYDPSKYIKLSNNMIAVMNAFGIPESDYTTVYIHSLQPNSAPLTLVKKSIEPKQITLPSYFRELKNVSIDIATIAKKYLIEREITVDSYPFYLSVGVKTFEEKKWYGRLIIPIYKDGVLIFYIGRTLFNDRPKYLSPAIDRDKILYGFDQLFTNVDTPLYIVEGFFDAFPISGIAVFSNRMTTAQIEWLNKSPRRKVVIPDRRGDGIVLAEQAIDLGWSVATPDIGDCKDIGDAITRYGTLYTKKTILDQMYTGFAARINARMYCDGTSKKEKRR